jgi:hypothetical protein
MNIYYKPDDEFLVCAREEFKNIPHTEIFTPSSQKGALNSFYGKHHTEESKKLISQNQKGWKHTEEAKQKISLARTGIKRPKSVGEKISKSISGENHHMSGKKCSKEVKDKISNTKSKNPYKHNEERRKKISDAAKLREAKKRCMIYNY